MAQWYVKDLSKLTGVSVQTLHHYDRIDLLKPSLRLPNSYRVYSEKDLLQLQQIIALKFFGFELAQIKTLLTDNAKAFEHFSLQAKLLEQKANALAEASNTLKQVISDVPEDKSIPWEKIIKLIEVYHMTQNLDHVWVKEILNPDELKQYAAFEKELQSNATEEQKAAFEGAWDNLVEEFKNNLNTDPQSKTSLLLAEKWMKWVNGVFGKKYAHLRTKIFEQGFGEGIGLEAVGLTPEIAAWMEKASDAYWNDRFQKILNQVGNAPSATVLNLWNEALDDLYGNEDTRKQAVYDIALADEKVSLAAKKWLKEIRNK